MNKPVYFLFNKPLDFERCMLIHMHYAHGVLRTDAGAQGNACAMISRVLDSREYDMEWHQFVYSMDRKGNPAVQLSIYTANSLMRQREGREESIEQILSDTGRSVPEKKTLLRPYLCKTAEHTDDILLHDVRGRYLWFVFEITLQAGQSVQISRIQIYFPKRSWNAYLPELYQVHDKDAFFERFLAVFQTIYESLNEKISRIPYEIDPDCADREFLEWMAGLLDLAQTYMWTDEQLRSLIKKAGRLYQIRGTRRAVLEMVHLYTGGAQAFVIENFETVPPGGAKAQLMEQLYGTDPYRFQVVVHEKDVPTVQDCQTLIQIINEVKPAHMELELVVLKPYIFLDRHTYLGMNSVLGVYRSLSLDGAAMLPFAVLGKDAAGQQERRD